ncbi:MAG: N-methyl-L-tryptophan oxidase [Anaerolineae bacterium]
MATYDIIIIGAGAMGSAAAYHAAKAGLRVLLIEQFEIDHQYGSSYGLSRIIRYAYTDPVYVKLAKAVYPMWAALEAEAGESLHLNTGGIDFGKPDEKSFVETLNSMRVMDIPHEIMSAAEAMKRYPQFHFDEDMIVAFQADYGALRASRAVRAHVRLAQQHGAELRDHTRVTAIRPLGDGVEVATASESGAATHSAARLILTAGAWAKGLLASLDLTVPLQPVHTQEIYFDPAAHPEWYDAGNMPVFIQHIGWHTGEALYGIPSVDGSGVKVAVHGGPPVSTEAGIDYTPDYELVKKVQSGAAGFLPDIGAGKLKNTRVCLYTMTPDEDFIIDPHPAYPQIVIGSPCSGHGFKFSTLIGKILVDLAVKGRSEHDLSRFRVTRFS